MEGVRAGYNVPIEYKGERIGVLGISGDPEEVGPFERYGWIETSGFCDISLKYS
ncbi:sugar diacid recognition domain-containing protein [Paenibacillus sp. yr247]|uniref:sugar diacid recognition domain-containing protein n=1 Tax=Paenibacillus sp. yr247 TaxID=1761880 RepID=UPI000B814CC1|nr:sugar diacid recognition domain-containing protein [Paenibacillus sp. yr247]